MGITCGVDIVEVERIKKAMGNKRFANRIFTVGEIAYCQSKKAGKNESYAVRFAAKEAVMKAFGTGMYIGMDSGKQSKGQVKKKSDVKIIADKNANAGVGACVDACVDADADVGVGADANTDEDVEAEPCLGFRDIEVLSGNLGKPEIRLFGRAKAEYDRIRAKSITVSLSHCRDYAVAMALIETPD